MSSSEPNKNVNKRQATSGAGRPDHNPDQPPKSIEPKEVGGRGGLDPTRYGDWEKAGRCVDF